MRDKRERWVTGDWNVLDQRSGFKKKASEVTRQWDGLYVSKDDVETRHPQQFVRARRDRQTPADVRPENTDRFLDDITDPESPSFIQFLISESGDQLIAERNDTDPIDCLVTE